MSVSATITERREVSYKRLLAGVLICVAIAIVGLLIVKWVPYWNKAFVAAAKHSIGASIVTGKTTHAEAVGFSAAWKYSVAYYKSVWQAVVLALVLGASLQVFVPRKWLMNLIGGNGFRSAAIAGAASMAGMMCTCCAAPVVVGMRNQRAGMASSLAFLLGNPVLNPATVIFMGFVLGWPFAGLRILFGLLMVGVVAWIANRFAASGAGAALTNYALRTAPIEDADRTVTGIISAWLKVLWIEIYTLLPGYIIIVFLLGGIRAWLFPPGLTIHASGIGAVALLSAIGTVFVIPTAGEIPIVQTLMRAGMSPGPAMALLMTLPAISLPTLFIVRKVFPRRVLATVLGCVFAVGIVAGISAMLLFRGV